ncbi:MAG: acylphosphatase [Armatimonadetes bacterium]|jgi:acylphosphatase|nr:MAG: acylphosphatase [Armatimonadota bacterium]
MKRLTAQIYGIVQGVGFRAFVLSEARRLGLYGYVRNCADGSVEVVAEGGEPSLRALLDALQSGPPGARVDHVETTFSVATGEFTGFSIRN